MSREILKHLLLNYFLLWFIVIAIAVVGVVLYVERLHLHRSTDNTQNIGPFSGGRRFGTALVIIAGILSLFPFSADSPWNQSRIMSRFVNCEEAEILSATVIPWDTPTQRQSWKRTLIVRDRTRIHELCQCLHSATAWHFGHPKREWGCVLTLSRTDGSSSCIVEGFNGGETTIDFYAQFGTTVLLGTWAHLVVIS